MIGHFSVGSRIGVAMLLIVGMVAGCSQDAVPVQAVVGHVFLEEKPLEGAIISFKPVGEGRVASGKTLPDGSYQLMTSGAVRNGAMLGDYVVVIQKEIEVDGQGKEINYRAQEYNPASGPQVRGRVVSQVPKNYTTAETSPLKATVKQGKNDLEFRLEK